MGIRGRGGSNASLTARIALDGGDEIKRELQELGRVGEAAFRKLENAAKQLNTSSGFEQSLIRIEKSLRRIGAQADLIGRGFQQVGRTLTTYVTVPLVALGTAAVRSFSQIEGAIANVGTLVDENVENLGEMRKEFLEIGRRVPTSFEELGQALYSIRSAGVDASDAMTVLERAAQLATAGLGTVGEAADIATSAINTWGLRGADASRIFDTLFITVAKGKTTIAELSQGFGAVASIVKEAGVSVEEFFAATAALTTTGLPASQAFNQIRAAIVGLTRPSERLTAVLDKLGVKSFDELIKREGSLVGAFKVIREAVGGTQAALIELVGRVEGVNAILGLTGNNAEAYADALEEIARGEGRLLDAFLARTEALDKRLEIFRNNITATLAELGARLEPALVSIIDGLTGLLQSFAELDDASKDLIVSVGGFLAVIGPLFLVLGSGLRVIGFAAKGFATLFSTLRRFNAFLGVNFGVGLVTFLEAVLLRITQIAGLVGFFAFIRNFINYEEAAAKAAREHAEALGLIQKAQEDYVKGSEKSLEAIQAEIDKRLQAEKAAVREVIAIRDKINAMLAERAQTPVGLLSPDGGAAFNAEVLRENNEQLAAARQRLAEIEAEADETANTIERMNTGIDETAQEVNQLTQAQDAATASIRVWRGDTVQAYQLTKDGVIGAAGEIEQYKNKVDETKESTRQLGEQTTDFEARTRRLAPAADEVAVANERVAASSEQAAVGIDAAAQAQADKFRESADEAQELSNTIGLIQRSFDDLDPSNVDQAGEAFREMTGAAEETGVQLDTTKGIMSQLAASAISDTNRWIERVKALEAWYRKVAAAARAAAAARVSGPGGSVSGSGDADGFASGGLFRGRPGIDTNLAWLTDKEYIINPRSVQKLGVGVLDYINRLGKLPGFAMGGLFEANASPVAATRLRADPIGGSMTVNFDLGDGVVIGPFSSTPDVARSVVEAASRKAQLATTRKPLRRRG
jgi:TP901 family phage tail tape measure protein